MLRLLLFLLLALPLSGRAATISSTTCPGSGCVTTYLGNIPATAVSVQVSGAWVGTIVFEGSNDGSSYIDLRGYPVAGGAFVTSTAGNGAWTLPAGGLLYVRVRASAWTSGSATVLPQPTSSTVVADVVRAVGSTFGEVSVTTATDGGLPVTLGSQRVSVEATGPGGDPVAIFGSTTTTLTPETVAALGPAPCTLRAGDWVTVSSASATPVPPDLSDGGIGAFPGRTAMLLVNASETNSVVCDPMTADGGTPEWNVRGVPLFSNGGHNEWEARDNVRIYCRAKSGVSVAVAPTEKSCAR